MSEIFHRFRVL